MKFKKAGEGHKLDAPSQRKQLEGDGAAGGPNPTRAHPSNPDAIQKAADAALARLSSKSKDSTVIVRARVRTEVEAEKRRILEAEQAGLAAQASPREVTLDGPRMLPDVLYCCAEIGEKGEIPRPREEMEGLIQIFLYNSLVEDPEMTSAVMIHTLNKQPEKVKTCMETLAKYLDNIINNPNEEKFRKIRAGNKVFQERVTCLQGTEEFLQAARFTLRMLPCEGHEEAFWVMEEEDAQDVQRLVDLKEVLFGAEPIRPQLHRALKVFHPSGRAAQFDIPDSYYAISPAELKKEQQRREEAVEKLGMLRTKAMRERDEMRELRKYRFTVIRVRFPDGILLQAVFKAQEKLSALRQLVGEQLISWLPFVLSSATGQKLVEDNLTLAELLLAPAAVVNFAWDPEVQRDIATQKGSLQEGPYLKPEVSAQIQSLK